MRARTAAAVALVGVALSAAPAAQRGRRGNANASAGLPVSTGAIVKDPAAYYGKQITLSAGVDHMENSTAFVVDQWKMTGPTEVQPIGAPVLVVAPYLTNTVDRRNYLIVKGELMKLDTTLMARVNAEYKLDLGPDLWAKYQGQPVLLASSVINSTYTELSKKPILPPTASELALSEAMKSISSSFAALRTAVQNGKADAVAQHAAALTPALARTEAVWDGVGQGAAGQYARDAQDYVASIAHDAAAGDWDNAKFVAGKLNAVCGSCHDTFRDRADDGTFRMKAGTF